MKQNRKFSTDLWISIMYGSILMLLFSCTTTVGIAHEYDKYEATGEHQISLSLDTIVVDSNKEVSTVKLPFNAVNNTGQWWIITKDNFRFFKAGMTDSKCSICNPTTSFITQLAPYTSAKFTVTFDFPSKDVEGEYIVSVENDSEVLSIRKFSIGTFNQISQTARFMLFFTGLLLIV